MQLSFAVLSSLLSGAVMLALGLPMGTIGSQESDSVRPESSSNVARPTLQASSEAIKTEVRLQAPQSDTGELTFDSQRIPQL
uniref:Uncharacterized protein n=1 Tax=Moniliophthora roreri TaxID=221103 RepID=A0A0W0FX80_MONRR